MDFDSLWDNVLLLEKRRFLIYVANVSRLSAALCRLSQQRCAAAVYRVLRSTSFFRRQIRVSAQHECVRQPTSETVGDEDRKVFGWKKSVEASSVRFIYIFIYPKKL